MSQSTYETISQIQGLKEISMILGHFDFSALEVFDSSALELISIGMLWIDEVVIKFESRAAKIPACREIVIPLLRENPPGNPIPISMLDACFFEYEEWVWYIGDRVAEWAETIYPKKKKQKKLVKQQRIIETTFSIISNCGHVCELVWKMPICRLKDLLVEDGRYTYRQI